MYFQDPKMMGGAKRDRGDSTYDSSDDEEEKERKRRVKVHMPDCFRIGTAESLKQLNRTYIRLNKL